LVFIMPAAERVRMPCGDGDGRMIGSCVSIFPPRYRPRRRSMSFFVTRPLRDARVLITGASGGIGRASAREFARRGARLVLNARRYEELNAVADELRSRGGEVETALGDVTSAEVRREMLRTAQSRFGGLDILVNNAGIGAFGRFDQADDARLRKIMEVDFFAAAELIRESLPMLRRGTKPLVVNISSILGQRGIPLASEYCAAKFALRGLSESLRAELAPAGIGVLVVCPGTTETGFFDNVLEMKSQLPWRKPGTRGTTPEYVARRTAWAVEHDKAEIVPSGSGKLLVLANRLFPRLVDAAMRRYGA
jgi:short-subunit dehydrogenase